MRNRPARYTATLDMRMLMSILLVLGFLGVVTVLYVMNLRNVTEEQINASFQLIASEIIGRIDRSFGDIEKVAVYIGYSQNTQIALLSKSHRDRLIYQNNAVREITNFKDLTPAYLDIMVYRDPHNKLSSVEMLRKFHSGIIAQYVDGDVSQMPDSQYSRILYTDAGVPCFTYMLTLRHASADADSREKVALCSVLCRIDGMLNPSQSGGNAQSKIMILDNEGNVYGTEGLEPAVVSELLAVPDRVTAYEYQGTQYLAYTTAFARAGWKMSYSLPRQAVVGEGRPITAPFVWSLMIGAFTLIAFFLYNLCYISYNIKKVKKAVESMDSDTHSAIALPNMYEMRLLAGQINSMLERISRSHRSESLARQRAYEALLAQQQAEMLAYKSQMNPHFLFNTLECIRSMAQLAHDEPVQRMIVSTSKILQYSLHSDLIVTLKDELDIVRHYFSIMSARSLNRYVFREQIDPDTLPHAIVAMTLQPLVENSILHGARSLKGRRFILVVRTYLEEDQTLVVRIVDNGRGISPSTLDKLNQARGAAHLDIQSKNSIGIHNICRRLTLMDKRCALRFVSSEGHYTMAEVRIPPDIAAPDLKEVRNG